GRTSEAAASTLAQMPSQAEGIGQVIVGGRAKPLVRVRAAPNQPPQLGIGLGEVRAALQRVNANPPKGELADAAQAWTITATDQLFEADQYRPVVVAYKNGAPVRLGDVATVESSDEDYRTYGTSDG